jgi:hypothetical protein
MNWEATEILLQLVQDQIIIEHNKPKAEIDESRLHILRKAAIGLHEQRIFLNMKRLKDAKK